MDQWVTIKLVDMVDISHSAIFEKSKIGPTYLCCISIRGWDLSVWSLDNAQGDDIVTSSKLWEIRSPKVGID